MITLCEEKYNGIEAVCGSDEYLLHFTFTDSPPILTTDSSLGTDLSIISSLNSLASLNIPVWLRYVLVPGYTDDMDAISKMGAYARRLGNVERIEVLPFHKMGEYKWEAMGRDYRLYDIQEPTPDMVARAKTRFEDEGVAVY